MIRKIEVHIDENGKFEAASDSFLGISGETGASQVEFILCDELINKIITAIGEKQLFYRFEVTDAQGRHLVLENKKYENEKSFSLNVTNAFTEYDGKITISLVFESEGFTLCTPPIDFKVEKGCGKAGEKAETKDTIVTLIVQTENKMNNWLSEADKRLLQAQNNAEKLLTDSTSLAKEINEQAVNNANEILGEITEVSSKAQEEISENLEQSNTILNECQKRKNAAEAASMNALQSANEAAASKAQVEMILSVKEDIYNKETNLLKDLLPNHTKYPSARAVQELVDNYSLSFSKQLSKATESLESTKAEKSELALTKQELAEAKAEIERLKTAEDFVLVEEIVCDGKTKTFYSSTYEPLKKIFIQVNSPVNFETTIGNFSCYANNLTGTSAAFVYTQATKGTKLLRLYSERIVNGVWKTDFHNFSANVYGASWNATYAASGIDYITSLKFSCSDGTHFLPEETTIKIYGVKA